MPLDKDTAALLDQLEALGAPDISTLSPEAARLLSFAPVSYTHLTLPTILRV